LLKVINNHHQDLCSPNFPRGLLLHIIICNTSIHIYIYI